MKKKLISLTVLLGALLIFAYLGVQFLKKQQPQDPSATGSKPSYKVTRQKVLQQVTLSGVIEPNRKMFLDAPYDGFVQKVYVKIGQKVKKGDPLALIAEDFTSSSSYPLRATFDGTVVDIQYQEGEAVSKAMTGGKNAAAGGDTDYILRVDDLSRLYVKAMATEMDLNKLKNEMKVIIKIQANPDKTYNGAIKHISLAALQGGGGYGRREINFPVSVAILDPDDAPKSGMSVLIDVITAERDNVLAIPPQYILQEKDVYYIFKKSGEKVPVKVGLKSDTFFEITSGVQENEKVMPVDFLKMSEQDERN